MVAPTLVLLMAICFDMCRLSLARHVVQNAVYDAARIAMMEGYTREQTENRVEEYLQYFGFQAEEDSIVVGQIRLAEDESGEVIEELNTTDEFDRFSIEFHVEANLPFENATLFLPASWVADKGVFSSIRLQSERYTGFFDADSAFGD